MIECNGTTLVYLIAFITYQLLRMFLYVYFQGWHRVGISNRHHQNDSRSGPGGVASGRGTRVGCKHKVLRSWQNKKRKKMESLGACLNLQHERGNPSFPGFALLRSLLATIYRLSSHVSSLPYISWFRPATLYMYRTPPLTFAPERIYLFVLYRSQGPHF